MIKKLLKLIKNKKDFVKEECQEDIQHKEKFGTKFFIRTPVKVFIDQQFLGNDFMPYLDTFPPESIYYEKIQKFKEDKKRMDISYYY